MPPSGAPSPPSPDPPTDAKQKIRRAALVRRKSLTPQERDAWSSAICRQILPLEGFRNARTVMVYLADGQEPDLEQVMQAALASGVAIAAPRIDWKAKSIIPCRVRSPATDIVPGLHGLTEPAPHCSPVPPGSIDLILVPGVAFDTAGNRLGRGGGFYDRFLALGELRALRVGVAFDFQIVPDVPAQAHDACMDLIVTPSRTIKTARPRDLGRG